MLVTSFLPFGKMHQCFQRFLCCKWSNWFTFCFKYHCSSLLPDPKTGMDKSLRKYARSSFSFWGSKLITALTLLRASRRYKVLSRLLGDSWRLSHEIANTFYCHKWNHVDSAVILRQQWIELWLKMIEMRIFRNETQMNDDGERIGS